MLFFLPAFSLYIYVYLFKMKQKAINTIHILSKFADNYIVDYSNTELDYTKILTIKTHLTKLNKLNKLQDFLNEFNIFNKAPEIKIMNKIICTTYIIDEQKEIDLYELLYSYVNMISTDKDDTYIYFNDSLIFESENSDLQNSH